MPGASGLGSEGGNERETARRPDCLYIHRSPWLIRPRELPHSGEHLPKLVISDLRRNLVMPFSKDLDDFLVDVIAHVGQDGRARPTGHVAAVTTGAAVLVGRGVWREALAPRVEPTVGASNPHVTRQTWSRTSYVDDDILVGIIENVTSVAGAQPRAAVPLPSTTSSRKRYNEIIRVESTRCSRRQAGESAAPPTPWGGALQASVLPSGPVWHRRSPRPAPAARGSAIGPGRGSAGSRWTSPAWLCSSISATPAVPPKLPSIWNGGWRSHRLGSVDFASSA